MFSAGVGVDPIVWVCFSHGVLFSHPWPMTWNKEKGRSRGKEAGSAPESPGLCPTQCDGVIQSEFTEELTWPFLPRRVIPGYCCLNAVSSPMIFHLFF